MKCLHIGFPDLAMQRGFAASFGRYEFVDWTAWAAIGGFDGLSSHLLDIISRDRWDVVFMQVQSPGVIAPDLARAIADNCGLLVNWTWDYREPMPDWYALLGEDCLTCFTNELDVRGMREMGYRSEFLQSGFDEAVYNPDGPVDVGGPDIVFMANNYAGENERFPLTDYRMWLIEQLRARYGARFGLYGFGWPGQSPLQSFMHRPMLEARAYRSAKVAINLSHFLVDRYTSDRMLRILGTGTLCLSHRYPGMEADFEDGRHLYAWDDPVDLFRLIDEHTQDDQMSGFRVGEAGCKLVHTRYTWSCMAERIKEFYKIYGKRDFGGERTVRSSEVDGVTG